MKKIILLLLILCFFCLCIVYNYAGNFTERREKEDAMRSEIRKGKGSLPSRVCASNEVLQEQIKTDPKLSKRLDRIEEFTKRVIKGKLTVKDKVQIPVVVNVLYRTPAENISDEQIRSQIDALNRDFNALNCDYYSVPATFYNLRANVQITFALQGIVRRAVTTVGWTARDSMKKSPMGIKPTTPTTVLNIWVCNMKGGVLGYAQFPGGTPATDGVVIDNNAFGTMGTAIAPFDLGRTATHEIGHWMNLRHIWGDAVCGDDFVDDTPSHHEPNYGSPPHPYYSLCSGNPMAMTMNYMDYTDDISMYMFSNGQKTRMLALFVTGGARQSFAQL